MKTFHAAFLLFALVAHGQNPPVPVTAEAEKKLTAQADACKQSTIDLIDVWFKQYLEDSTYVEKLSYQELQGRVESINGCLLMIDKASNPKANQEDSRPRELAYRIRALLVQSTYEQEQSLRLLHFIEARGLKKAFLASSYGPPK